MAWAKKYKFWKVENWRKVLFSDESNFEVHGTKLSHVRRSNNETVSPKHLQQTVKHPVKQMFWGCFGYHGLGPLLPITGMMNSAKYIPILQSKVIRELKKWKQTIK